jgi:hypothetical protein
MRRTREHLLLSIVLITASPALAGARATANPADRLVREVNGSAQMSAPAQLAAYLVPLPDNAVQLDSTTYDLQDMGSLGTRIVVAPNGVVHVAWQDDLRLPRPVEHVDPARQGPGSQHPELLPDRVVRGLRHLGGDPVGARRDLAAHERGWLRPAR